ncbi:MAG: hypothetical protein R6U89_02215, partial [Dehalococcoidia bacterium]
MKIGSVVKRIFLIAIVISLIAGSGTVSCYDYGDEDEDEPDYTFDRFMGQFHSIVTTCKEDSSQCHPFAERVALQQLYEILGSDGLKVWKLVSVLYPVTDTIFDQHNSIKPLEEIADKNPALADAIELIQENPDLVSALTDLKTALDQVGALAEKGVGSDQADNAEDMEIIAGALSDFVDKFKKVFKTPEMKPVLKVTGEYFDILETASGKASDILQGETFKWAEVNASALKYSLGKNWPGGGSYNIFGGGDHCYSWGYYEMVCEGDDLVLKDCERDKEGFAGSWREGMTIKDCGEAGGGCEYSYHKKKEGMKKFTVSCADRNYARYRHPAGDHTPDETFDLSSDQPFVQSSQISEPGTPCGNGTPCAVAASPSADVAVLARGFPSAAGELLEHNGIDYNLVDVSLASSPALMRYPVL